MRALLPWRELTVGRTIRPLAAGLKAQFRVMAASVKEDKAAENGSSSWRSGATAHALLASLAAAAALLALGL